MLIICTLGSCKRSAENSDSANYDQCNTLRIDIPAPIQSLDPTTGESGSIYIFHFLYDSLFSANQYGQLIPELATSFEYNQTGFSLLIHLKKGPKFHNGKEVKASDVAYSLHQRLRTLRPEYFDSVVHITSGTDGSVRIDLKKDDPEFILKIFSTEVVPEPIINSDGHYDRPIGSGPFIFEYRNGEREVGLVANKDYHQGKPALDRVKVYFEPNNERSWARLINGITDAAFGINPVDHDMMVEYQDEFYLNTKGHSFYAILLYNTHDSILRSRRFRTALSLAIDKQTIIREILKGYGQPATGPLDPGSPSHDRKLKPVPFSPQEAVKLIMEEGWTYGEADKYFHKHGTPLEFSLLYAAKDRLMKSTAEYLQLNLNDIGIKAHLVPLPVDELVRRYDRNTEFQVVLTEMYSSFTPENMRALWSPIGSAKSMAGCFEHSDLTRILTEATAERNPQRAIELYQEAEALVTSLQPGTFLFHRTYLDVISRRIAFPYPFSFSNWDIHRLRSASIRDLEAPNR